MLKMQLLKNYIGILILTAFQQGYAQNGIDYYVQSAQNNSPLIQDNKNQSEAAKVEAERIKAFYTKPQVTVSASYLFSPIISADNGKAEFVYNSNGADKYYGYDMATSNGGTYQGLLNVNQSLFNGVRYKTAVEQAMVGKQINENNIQLTSHDIEKIVTDQYVLCLQDLKQTDYLESLIKIINEQKTIVNKLVESGLLKQSDALLLNIEYQTQQNSFNSFKATYRRDLMDLNILCGINDTSYIKVVEIDLKVNPTITASKFTEKYRLDSLNLIASKKMFELKYKPQLNAFANTGLNAVYLPTLPNRFGMSAGLNFSMYLFDGKQKSLNQKKTDILLKSTEFYKSNFINQNTVRKNKILTELKSLEERTAIASNQLKDYKQLLEYYKQELIRGQLSVIAYVNTVKNMAAVQRDYILMQTNKQLLINTFNYWNW